jgi:hypothetical protein
MDKQALASLLELYLQLNPSPSDAQFHQLAGAIGVDKEELEAVAYQMLGEEIQHEQGEGDDEQLERLEVEAAGDLAPSEAQDVLDGDYDPQTTTSDDLALNDGAPAGTSSQQGNQDATYNDGVTESDTGIDLDSGKDDMIADGIAPVQLKAAARLATVVKANTYTDCDRWCDDFEKKYPGGETRPDRSDPNDRNLIAYDEDGNQVGYWKFTGDRDHSMGIGNGSLK